MSSDAMAEGKNTTGPAIELSWRNVPRKHQLYFELPQILCILGVLSVAFWLHPGDRLHGTHQQLGLPPCAFYVLTGIPCPSCGLTTSFSLMVHGRFLRAFQAHYFGPLLFLATIGYLVLLTVSLVRGQRLQIDWPSWMPLTILLTGFGLYLACWIVRVMQNI